MKLHSSVIRKANVATGHPKSVYRGQHNSYMTKEHLKSYAAIEN